MSTLDLTAHPAARAGFSVALMRIELRRLLRNKRTMIFTLVFPIAMLLIVNSTIPKDQQSMGPGIVANVGAYLMVSMALYGVVMAATTGGASVSIERASGWSRQLRLTPLNPTAYIMFKILSALVLAAIALAAAYGVGAALGIASMAAISWAESALVIFLGATVFAAFGLFMGYLIPSDNVMQFVGPMMAILGFLGGLFQGPVDTSTVMGTIQSWTPIYGLAQIAHWPLTRTTAGDYATFDKWWTVNLAAWGLVFIAGAVWRFRRDTARV